MGDIWFPLIFCIVAGVIAVFAWIASEKRRKALAEFAFANGLEFTGHPGDLHDRYSVFQPFSSGHSRKCSNLIHGRRGEIAWELFDFRYKTGSGKNQTTHHVGVVLAKVPLALPKLRMRPEGIFDKLAAVVGFDDIDFESAEFSRKYHVNSADRKLAYDLIHPRMIEYLLARPPCDWQFNGPIILIHRKSHYKPDELPPIMALIEGFIERIPAYLREDIGAGRPHLPE